jgi:DNA-binding NarL/FixJ family response regulator
VVAIRVLIAGRRPDVRRALEIRLALEGDICVVGSTASVEAALAMLSGARPGVLLVDLDLAPAPSEEVLGRARSLAPGLRVILLTHHDDARSIAAADEVVTKGPDASALVAAVRRPSRRRAQGFV